MSVRCKAYRWVVRVRKHGPGPSRTLQLDGIDGDKCRLVACTQGSKSSMADDDPEGGPAWEMSSRLRVRTGVGQATVPR